MCTEGDELVSLVGAFIQGDVAAAAVRFAR
jgi:hypothetical protein